MSIPHTRSSQLTDEQYSIIGKLLTEFSNMDFLLGLLLNKLLITPDFIGRTYTDKMSAQNKIDAINNALVIHRDRYRGKIVNEKLIEEIINLIQDIKGSKNIRNKFAHYIWSRWTDDKIFGTQMSGQLPNLEKPNRDSLTITNKALLKQFQLANRNTEKMVEIIERLPKFEEEKIFEIFKS